MLHVYWILFYVGELLGVQSSDVSSVDGLLDVRPSSDQLIHSTGCFLRR